MGSDRRVQPGRFVLLVGSILGVAGAIGYWNIGRGERERKAEERRTMRRFHEEMEKDRDERREQYRALTEKPCGPRRSMINTDGDAMVVCERDLAHAIETGWILAPADAGQ